MVSPAGARSCARFPLPAGPESPAEGGLEFPAKHPNTVASGSPRGSSARCYRARWRSAPGWRAASLQWRYGAPDCAGQSADAREAERSCPILSRAGQRVLEIVRMLSVRDDDGHRAGQPDQLASARVRHYADDLLRRAARHGAAVLQDKCAAAAAQTPGYLLDRHVTGRALDASGGGQHLALARGLQVAMKLLVDGHPADRSRCGVHRLRSYLHFKCSACMHRVWPPPKIALARHSI